MALIEHSTQQDNTCSFQVYAKHLPRQIILWAIKQISVNLRVQVHSVTTIELNYKSVIDISRN